MLDLLNSQINDSRSDQAYAVPDRGGKPPTGRRVNTIEEWRSQDLLAAAVVAAGQ